MPYVSEFQGVVERCNRFVSEITRIIHVQSKLCRRFWPYAMNTSHGIYRTRHNSSLPEDWSPIHALECHAVSSRELHPFGCVAWVTVMTDKQNAACDAGDLTEKCLYLGPASPDEGNWFYHPPTKRVIRRISAQYDEMDFPGTTSWDSDHAYVPEVNDLLLGLAAARSY